MARAAVLVALAFGAFACREEHAARPATRMSATPLSSGLRLPKHRMPCASGGGRVADARFEAWFPRVVGSYCLDGHADQRVFGGTAGAPLGEASELLALEPERLERVALREVVSLAYVEDRASGGRVSASVLRFASADAAYGFFTERIAAAEELGRPAFALFDAGAEAVSGDGLALVVRAESVLRLDFSNASVPPDRVAEVARAVLRPLGVAIAAALPGEARLPPAASLLPVADRLPLSLRYDPVDLCGIDGMGPGARATYADDGQRYRMALAVRLDRDAAKDVISSLRKREGTRVLKRAPYDALRVAEEDPASGGVREWIFGRKGELVAGVALDAPPRAVPRGAPPERSAAVLKMKRLLDALPSATSW